MVCEEQHLRLLCQFRQHLESGACCRVIKVDHDVVDHDGQRPLARYMALDGRQAQSKEQLVTAT